MAMNLWRVYLRQCHASTSSPNGVLGRERRNISHKTKSRTQSDSGGEWRSSRKALRRSNPKHLGGSEKLSAASVSSSRKRSGVNEIVLDEKKAESILLYKDENIIALNKPSGLAVHGGPNLTQDLSEYLHLWQYDASSPPQLAHRLDKDISGVLLLTRHTESARKMAKLFHDRKIIKKYWAITVGVPDKMSGSIQIPLTTKNIATQERRHSMNRVVLRTDCLELFSKSKAGTILPSGIQLAWTDYKVQSVCPTAHRRCCLMEVQPITGFKHQLRVHLADGLMCPVVGDHKFSGPLFRLSVVLKKKIKAMDIVDSHMYLHAHSIEIPGYHDNKNPLIIKAPPPMYFTKTAKSLGLVLPR